MKGFFGQRVTRESTRRKSSKGRKKEGAPSMSRNEYRF